MHMYTSSSIVICSRCKKPGYLSQICFARNKSMGKLPFLAHKHAWRSLHRTSQHDNSAYINQRRGSKHGTSRHHRFGQQNGQRNFDPTSTTLVDAYSPAASSSSSSPAHISYFFFAASSRSNIIAFDQVMSLVFLHTVVGHKLLAYRDGADKAITCVLAISGSTHAAVAYGCMLQWGCTRHF